VGKRYSVRQPWVLKAVTAEVTAGQVIQVTGRNGSGKSTLLRVAAGVCMPSKGRVLGRPRTGYVPERFPGGFAFSARDYLTHMARVHGLRGSAARAGADDWLQRLGATPYAEAPLRTLSKGMCQKVAIAQALVAQPELLVLDEAWTGLDAEARAELDSAIRDRAAAGGAVLFVDHGTEHLTATITGRWVLDGDGSVRVTGSDAEAVMVIEVRGLDALPELPGVLSRRGGVLHVATWASDDVLRAVLTVGGHVVSVR
jgi:ABC-2 type transport system ATP-binding protein